MYGVAQFFTGDKTDFLPAVFFIEEDKTGGMPCLVCFAIDRVKSLGAFDTVE